jgi:hypothetical protein
MEFQWNKKHRAIKKVKYIGRRWVTFRALKEMGAKSGENV